MQPACADRHAQADLAGALRHRYQQDVHDADAADHQRYRSDRGEQQRHDAAAAFGRLRDLTEVSNGEIIHLAGTDAVPARENFRHLDDRRLNLARTDGLYVDLVHVADQPLLKVVGVGWQRIDPVERRLLLTWRGDAEDLTLGGREGDHDEIVLIGTEWCLSFRRENANHTQRHAFDLDDRADRVGVGAEQLAGNGLAKDHDQRGVVVVVLRNAATRGDLPVGDGRIIGTDALNVGRPVLIGVLHLPHLADEIAHTADRAELRGGPPRRRRQ